MVRVLYLDCGMGAAEDMLSAALTELLPDPEEFLKKLPLFLPSGVEIKRESDVKCGVKCTRFKVVVNGEPECADKSECTDKSESADKSGNSHGVVRGGTVRAESLIRELELPQKVKGDAVKVCRLIAAAENHVYGTASEDMALRGRDAVVVAAYIVSVCLMMEELSPDEVAVSPVNVGSGYVKCENGPLPVPTPATAFILKGMPIYVNETLAYGNGMQGELCTPVAAALLRHFATSFGHMPPMKVTGIGYGAGNFALHAANYMRAMLGETEDKSQTVLELSCNVDDMTAEAIAFAAERLFEGGAYEVYTVPVGMKKSRPGTLIRVVCGEKEKEKLLHLLFLHTTTIGVRETATRRYVMESRSETLMTLYGKVRRKVSDGFGVCRKKYEYEDLARIAAERGLSLEQARKLAEKQESGEDIRRRAERGEDS